MEKNTIDNLNIALTKILDLKEAFNELSSTSHKELSEKLKEFEKEAKSEAENLTKAISEFGGEVETSERHTDQNAISWVSRPLPNADDVDEVVECLLKAEKKREEELNQKFSGKDVEREVKNLFMVYKQQNEANIVYLQSVKDSLEKSN